MYHSRDQLKDIDYSFVEEAYSFSKHLHFSLSSYCDLGPSFTGHFYREREFCIISEVGY